VTRFRAATVACALAACVVAGRGAADRRVAADGRAGLSHAESNYLLSCAGCHGLAGASNVQAVPELKGLVGYYLRTPEGRAYLPRLPNIAFAALSDRDLAEVLNYVVFDLGGASAPVGAKPYGAAEIARGRARPLTEVALSAYRRRLVATLIARYGAPPELRAYDAAAAAR
jgi:mono/diheme cytochrome c family protein